MDSGKKETKEPKRAEWKKSPKYDFSSIDIKIVGDEKMMWKKNEISEKR